MGKQGLREATAPREIFFNRGTETHRDISSQWPGRPKGRRVGVICSHSVHLTDWSNGCKTRWIISTDLAQMQRVESAGHSALRVWAGNWAGVIIVAQTEPHPYRTTGKKKNEAQPPSSCRILEDLQNRFGQCKFSRKAFSPLKSKTIKPGAVRTPEMDPGRSQKVNTNSWDKFHFATLQNLHFFYFLFSVFSILFVFYCLICFFILSFTLHLNFSPFTSLVFQITHYCWSFTFYPFYSDYIFLIILLLF